MEPGWCPGVRSSPPYLLRFRPDIEHYLPMDPDNMDMFEMVKDGLILAKLINDSVADTIDERALNKGHNLNRFKQVENGNLVVNSAKAIGSVSRLAALYCGCVSVCEGVCEGVV